jgi:hypothetical protein
MVEARLKENLDRVLERIAAAARRSGRQARQVTLVAVVKRRPIEAVRTLYTFGVRDVGENYPQELWEKSAALNDLEIRWHLIGHLQSNKAKKTWPMVHMVHGVDSLKLLRVLDELSVGLARPASVCLQVNASGEATKHGWTPEALLADSEAIAACQHVPIMGLMTMAAPCDDPEEVRPTFTRLRDLLELLRQRTGLALPELSMGMSGDYEVAIEEGATMVRVGTALFEGALP